MIGNRTCGMAAVVLGLTILVMPLLAQSGATRIKVSVVNASLRDKPSLDAEILEENITLGTVFTVEKKTGEWYEVKYQSQLGVEITGYIHEMYVEVLPAEPAAKPVRPPVKAPEKKPQPAAAAGGGWAGFEIGLGAGAAFGSPVSGESRFSYEWGPVNILLRRVDETGTVTNLGAKTPLGLGVSLGYYFRGGFGFRLRLDANFKQNISGQSGGYSATLHWLGGTQDSFVYDVPWSLKGEVSLTPVSFSLMYRLPLEGAFRPYLGVGVSSIQGRVKADTKIFKAIAVPPFPFVDLIELPVRIDSSLNSVGFNAGLGTDIALSPAVSLNLDALYIFGKNSTVRWKGVTGSYITLVYHLARDVQADQLAPLPGAMTLRVDTSFFKVITGLKFRF